MFEVIPICKSVAKTRGRVGTVLELVFVAAKTCVTRCSLAMVELDAQTYGHTDSEATL
jgi:hypothetical protein